MSKCEVQTPEQVRYQLHLRMMKTIDEMAAFDEKTKRPGIWFRDDGKIVMASMWPGAEEPKERKPQDHVSKAAPWWRVRGTSGEPVRFRANTRSEARGWLKQLVRGGVVPAWEKLEREGGEPCASTR